MRSLVALPTETLGGAERVLKTLSRALARRRERVDIIFLSRPDRGAWRDLPENVHLHFTGARNERAGVLPASRIVRELSVAGPFEETLSSHTHINAWLGLLRAGRLLKTQSMIFRESTIMVRRFRGARLAAIRSLYYLGYRNADLVICQTPEMLRELGRFIPMARTWNTKVIPNPVEAELGRQRILEAVVPPPTELAPYIVTAGRLIPEKGVDILLQSFSALSQDHPALKLLILGDGGLRAALQTQTEQLGLVGKVLFLGRVANPFPYYAGAEAGVVSSRIEGFPNVLLEMLAACRRVVATRCADGVGAIDGVHDCATEDAAALTASMKNALDEPASLHRDAFERELQRRTPDRFLAAIDDALKRTPA